MIWQKIPGLETTKSFLIELHKHNQLPHAILLSGKEGSAVLPIALGFSQFLLCDTPKDLLPCGECKSCKQTQNLFYPGFQIILPKFSTAKSDEAENQFLKLFFDLFKENIFIGFDDILKETKDRSKQALISVQDIHRVIESTAFTAEENKYKIIIIWMPELMPPASANKLLKTLEEPPPQTLFMLVSYNPEKLLPTIISRLQQIPVPIFTDEQVSTYLINHFSLQKEKADDIAFIAEGNINKAIQLIENIENYYTLLNDLKAFIRNAIKFDFNEIEKWIKNYEDIGREGLKRFFEYSLGVLHNALLFNYQAIEVSKVTDGEKSFIEKLLPYVRKDNISTLHDLFNDAYHQVSRNANMRTLLIDLFLRCNETLPKKVTNE